MKAPNAAASSNGEDLKALIAAATSKIGDVVHSVTSEGTSLSAGSHHAAGVCSFRVHKNFDVKALDARWNVHFNDSSGGDTNEINGALLAKASTEGSLLPNRAR